MAEGVVFSIAKNILDLLSPHAQQKIGELWGVKDELRKLQITVSNIQAVLLHAEEIYHQSPQVRQWVVQLKDALYDAEDLLGYFYAESQPKDLRSQNKEMKEVRTFFSSSNQLILRFKMASKLKEVRIKIDAVKEARKFHLDELPMDGEVRIANRRQENERAFVPMGEIIGRDDDKKEIRKLLFQDFGTDENVSVVSIVGIGGLGKTALAKYVFNEEDVKKHFQPRMWVTVSDEFNLREIVGNIIATAKDAETPKDLGMEQMERRLHEEIHGKRYLLVLDDLWNENREKWVDLKKLLDGGARGSKILITTRLPIVAETSGDFAPHVLKGLTQGESLDLFMRCASSKGQNIPEDEKISIGKEIIKKCHGVPLALRVIGGTFYLKKTSAEWLFFKDNDLQKIAEREEEKVNPIIAVLRVSHDHLPRDLKQCFAYCSLFPKDFQIKKSTLTSLWVAQGFIPPSLGGDQDLEQKAHDSFMDLLHRGFFQDRDDDDLGNVITCKMHDLMHDLACQVAGIECNVIGPSEKDGLHSITPRHLSYPSNEILSNKFPKLQLENRSLRTLLSTQTLWPSSILPELACHKLMSSLKYLRALTLCNTDMIEVPSCLCKLKLLSYLDLSYNEKLERLPKSIKSLQNLMTMILTGCYHLKELPRDIWKLVKLTNLDLPPSTSMKSMPRGLEKVTSLRRLTKFVAREDSSKTRNCAKLSELGGLKNLRTQLTIEMVGCIKNAAVESKSANLKGKQFLDGLRLFWRTDEDNRQNEAKVITNHEALLEGLQPHPNLHKLEIVRYEGTIFPRWMMEDIAVPLPNLVEVEIYGCRNCRNLPPLGRLLHLKRLRLLGLDEVESIGISIGESSSSDLAAPSPSFPSLLELRIIGCPKLKSMPSIIKNVEELFFERVSAELVKQPFRLPRLRDLEIGEIENLESLPDWVQHCTALEFLKIGGCKKWRYLPPLGRLPHLKRLELWDLDEVESIGISIGESSSSDLAAPSPSCPSLLELRIIGCPKLKSLPSIESVEELDFRKVSAELVKQPFRLPRLRYLEIRAIENLESLPDWVQHCTALEILEITECKKWRYLPPLGRLPRLKSLYLFGLDEVESIGISIGESSSSDLAAPSPSCPSLLELRIIGCPKLKSLPSIESVEELVFGKVSAELVKQPFRLPRLRYLEIGGIKYLESLPDWVQHCTALETLYIKSCKDLASLPESMTQLKSLQNLLIRECSRLLTERCQREIGGDWHKIKHIPRIVIDE